MFGLSVPELAILALMCLPIVLLIGVMLKKMGYSDLTAIGLTLLVLTPLNWLVLAYVVFFKWPIHEELELLRRQVADKATPRAFDRRFANANRIRSMLPYAKDTPTSWRR